MRIAMPMMSLELGGGAEHDLVNLSAGLKKAGHEPVVITSGGRLCKDVEANGVPVISCPLNTRSLPRLRRNGIRLADIAESMGVEVFNPQGVYPAVSCKVASRRLWSKGIVVPNIVTIPMLNRLKWWYYKLGAFMINRVADHVIVESDCERLRLQNRGMNRPLTVLYNCFPSEKYASSQLSREEIRGRMEWGDKIVFIMSARMTEEKNHRLLFDALARPEFQHLQGRVLFYLAGDGPLLETNRALVGEVGLEPQVVFGGFRRDIPELLRGADVFVLCSRYESLPLSIREGMEACLPVVATDVGGISEAVEDGQSGLLVPSGDPAGLAHAIVRMASDADLRRRMGNRGRQICREKFDYDNWIARTVELMGRVRGEMLARRRP